MKRILSSILICMACMFLFVGCFGHRDPMNPIMKMGDVKNLENCSIKLGMNYDAAASYYITPEGFDYDKLEESGYKMKIVVSYQVYYKKDYSLSFGYAGSPKYEVSIMNNDLVGVMDSNLSTTTTSQLRSISYVQSITNIRNTRLLLTFSTNNIQNVIYFTNITVNYTCVK